MPIGFVDTTLYSGEPPTQGEASYMDRSSFCGPIEVGGALYLVLEDRTVPSATFAILVYKSIDNGSTWSLVSGTSQLATAYFQWTSVGYAAPRIWCLYATTPDSGTTAVLHVVAFNTDTDTWETAIDVPTNSVGTDLRVWDLTVQTDGTLTVVYTLLSPGLGGVANVWYVRYNGSWGSHTQISTSDDMVHCGLFLDPLTNDTHVFYTGRNIFGSGPLRATLHRAIDSSGTLGANTQLLPAPGTPNAQAYPTFGVGCIWNDQIVVPYNRQTGGSPVPAVFIGTPVSSPVWTSTDLPVSDPDGRLNTFTYSHCVALLDGSGNLNVFWGALQYDLAFTQRYPTLFLSVDTGGGFSDYTTYYDSAVDTPSPAPDLFQASGVFMPSAALLSTGIGIALEMIFDLGYTAEVELYLASTGGGGGGFIPWRVIVDLYGTTQLSALEPAGTPLTVIT